MDAQHLFKAGKLDEAIAALSNSLRDNPGDVKSRTFLFELLCFAGDFDRAEKQLNALEQETNKNSVLGTFLYRAAIMAERTRKEMFEAKTHPQRQVNGVADTVSGKLNGKEFQTLSDADPRIGGKLEVFAAGDYMWLSYRDIAALHIEPPKLLRDLLWIPAKLTTSASCKSKDLGDILLPGVAPLSFQHPDDEVRLGRVSEWCEDEQGVVAPFGQKTLLVDGEEFPFLEVRELEIYPQSPAVE
jgi:type VI secretion system protein ImpE